MAKSAKKGKSTKKSAGKVKAKKAESAQGDHLRRLAPPASVKAVLRELSASKSRASEAGQVASTAMRRFTDAGGNGPAVRIAQRIYSKAQQDSIKARVLWEDVKYYLEECTDFNKIAPAGMFTAEEGGQKRSRRAKQTEMELPEASEEPAQQNEQDHDPDAIAEAMGVEQEQPTIQ